MNYKTCPQCKKLINSDRSFGGVSICQACGWTQSSREKGVKSLALISYALKGLVIGSVFLLSLSYIKYWDTYALEALPLQVKKITGIATSDELFTLVELCEKRKNLRCAINYSEDLIKRNQGSLRALEKRSHNLYLHNESELAMTSYEAYFKYGGKAVQALYEYARLLKKNGHLKSSIVQFEKVIKAKPDMLQITILEHYIKALIEDKQFVKAKKTIEYVQKNASKTFNFMETDLNKLIVQLNPKETSLKKPNSHLKRSKRAYVLPEKRTS